ncbi:MAG: hypothetical protein ABL959_02050 [Pyrinomonadaceae bacterium]
MYTIKLISRTARSRSFISRFSVLLLSCAFLVSSITAQQTAGGTVISNQASATYSDGNGNNFSTVSNTVTVTVSNVSGIAITPDAGTRGSVVAGQQGVIYSLRVTNTGNFADQVRFLASGQSIQITGSGTIAAAVIDVDSSGTLNGGDTDVLTNGSDVLSASIAQNGYVDVLVSVNVNSNATSGSSINVQLGDASTGSPTYDNQTADTVISAHEVRTVSGASVNGLREARGDMSASVDSDALAVLSLTAPAGPVALGSDISYSWQLCNTDGQRAAQSVTLTNGTSGSNTGVFIIAPIPIGTALKSGQSFPAGTMYSTQALTVDPLTATYSTSAPGDLTTVRRIAFNVGSTVSEATCATAIPMVVTITTTDATLDIFEIGDAFAKKFFGTVSITDQSGDTVANAGDGNADFNEGSQPGNIDGNGIQQVTQLIRTSSVLIGPLGSAGATGTNNNDDYTNRSITTGIAGVPFGGVTNADGTIVFSNTVTNTGNTNDTFVFTVPTAPSGFTVEISLDGTNYTTITSNSVSLAIAYGSSANIFVRVTAPSGTVVLAENGFPVLVRCTPTITASAYNETIDRLYTGFLRMDKTATVTNGTGVGGATDPVPGAVVEYTIVYRNLSSTGGTGNSALTVSNLVITESGSSGSNNWGSTTDQVVGSASDTLGGTITGDSAGSSILTDTISTLAAQATGTFKFRRVIH